SPEENPFHVRELDFEEFRSLITRYFLSARFLGQRIHPGSSIWPIGEARFNGFHEFVVERGASAFEFIGVENRIPLYFISVASDSPAILTTPASVLLDQSNSLLIEKNEELEASIKEARWREQQVADCDQTIKSRDETIKSLQDATRW